jgi:RNA polymerase sigma-70 factor (ECF subfamily)
MHTPGEPVPLQDRQTFENLYTRTHLIVFRFIYGLYGGPVEEIEDLTAETFIRAWKARGRFSGDENAAVGWLLRIARNLVIDRLRRDKIRLNLSSNRGGLEQEEYEMEFPGGEPDPEEQAALHEQLYILRDLLLALPVEQREMLVLRYMLSWPVRRIAGHLGLLENTVSVYLRRALQRLRERWPQD